MVVGVFLMVACAARVPPASVEQHRLVAYVAEELGIAQEARYDPTRLVATIPCMELCFYPWTNPTEVHHQEAKRLWRLAKRHQRASRKLRVAEERACLGVPEHARDVSSFVDCSNILAIEWPQQHEDPFVVEFAVRDALVDAFRTQMACHVARNESRGRELPELECPLRVCGSQARVVAIHEAGFRVEMYAADERTRAEIRERLTGLIQATPDDGRVDTSIQQPSQRQ